MHPYLFNDRPLWGVIFSAGFVAFFFVGSWVSRRERGRPTGDIRDRGSRMLIYLATAIGLACAFGAPILMPFAAIRLAHENVFALAMILFWSGLLLYVWAVVTLGAFFRTSVQLLEGQQLVTRGPYRLIRHPAYAGGILLFAGIGLATGNWISFVSAPLSVAIAYAWRIRVEEIALSERFGEAFETRRRRTWAVFPPLW